MCLLCVLQSGTFNPHSSKKPTLSPTPARRCADGPVLTSFSPRRGEDTLCSKDAPFQILLWKTGTELLIPVITVCVLGLAVVPFVFFFVFFSFLFACKAWCGLWMSLERTCGCGCLLSYLN